MDKKINALFSGNLMWNGYLQALPGALALGTQGVVRDGVVYAYQGGKYVAVGVASGFESAVKTIVNMVTPAPSNGFGIAPPSGLGSSNGGSGDWKFGGGQ